MIKMAISPNVPTERTLCAIIYLLIIKPAGIWAKARFCNCATRRLKPTAIYKYSDEFIAVPFKGRKTIEALKALAKKAEEQQFDLPPLTPITASADFAINKAKPKNSGRSYFILHTNYPAWIVLI